MNNVTIALLGAGFAADFYLPGLANVNGQVRRSEGSLFTDVTRGTPVTAFTHRSAGCVVEKTDIETEGRARYSRQATGIEAWSLELDPFLIVKLVSEAIGDRPGVASD